MIAQRTFKKAYVDFLTDKVRNGIDLELYGKEFYPYDPEEVVIIPSLRYPENLKNQLIPTPQGDCESAIALYEAYTGLTPLQAADRSFWTYLTHADLFEYVQARFPKIQNQGEYDRQYIWNHWFSPKDWPHRHPLASLWWAVYMTIDETNKEDKYKYTKFFFKYYTFRTNFSKYTIARHKELLIGYFEFLINNPDITSQYMEARNRFITKHFNKLGGTKLLSTLNRDYFTEELNRIKPQILAVTGTIKEDDEEDFI